MGVAKRTLGLLRGKDFVPYEAQVIFGLIKPRDPEAFKERKRAEREAKLERLAIQEEAKREGKAAQDVARSRPVADWPGDGGSGPAGPPRQGPREVHPASPARDQAIELGHAGLALRDAGDVRPAAGAAVGPAAAPPAAVLTDDAPAWGDDRPVRAQPGWYRLGRNFYRAGSGPFPTFGEVVAPRGPARIQLTLF